MAPGIAKTVPVEAISLQSRAELLFAFGEMSRSLCVFEKGFVDAFGNFPEIFGKNGGDIPIIVFKPLAMVAEFSVRAGAGDSDYKTGALNIKGKAVGRAPRID